MSDVNFPSQAKASPLAAVASDVASLPEDKFLEAVELLSIMSEHDPVGSLLTGLRPRLRTLRPTRVLTVKRLLCDPFEDLLYDPENMIQIEGKVPRKAIEPLWRLLQRRNGTHFISLQTDLKAISRREPKRVADLSERVWRTASATLAMEGELGKGVPPALPLIRAALAAGPEIARFKREIPANPILKIDKQVGAAIQKGLTGLIARGKSMDAFLYVVTARLQAPTQLLTFLDTIDIAIPRSISERLKLSSIDDLASETLLFRSSANSMEPELLVSESVRLVKAVIEAQRSLGSSAKSILAAKTQGLAEAIRNALRTQVIDRVPDAVELAFSSNATTESMIEAESLARAMWASRQATSLVGLDRDRDSTVATIRGNMLGRIQQSISVLDRSKDKVAPIPVDQIELTTLYRSIRMIELVEGVDAASPYIDKARSYG